MAFASTLPAVLSPVVTPFTEHAQPDLPRLVRHCQWLQSHGVGLAVFGTNSEANSMSLRQKRIVLEGLASAGIPGAQMMPGTGACAVEDAVELSKAALQAGAAGVLMLPPFYYKGVSDDGLFAYYSDVIQGVADDRLKIYVYNIPPVSQVGLSLALLQRLTAKYPSTVIGIKDSSGDWAYTESVLRALVPSGFRVYAGNETFLLRTMALGGVGCISATANVHPGPMAALANHPNALDAEAQQARLDQVRTLFQKFPMMAAMKAALATALSDPMWERLLPPLVPLTADQRSALERGLQEIDFSMPGLPSA
jgi:4-hydroxy-tetrahydrodipicolinate synthase